MAKENQIELLPDVEMYGGNGDTWVFHLFKQDGSRYTYSELNDGGTSFQLVIREIEYITRGAVSDFKLVKSGTLTEDDDEESAVAVFSFATLDTLDVNGKFVYQFEMSRGGVKQIAQGNLFIRRNINP